MMEVRGREVSEYALRREWIQSAPEVILRVSILGRIRANKIPMRRSMWDGRESGASRTKFLTPRVDVWVSNSVR